MRTAWSEVAAVSLLAPGIGIREDRKRSLRETNHIVLHRAFVVQYEQHIRLSDGALLDILTGV